MVVSPWQGSEEKNAYLSLSFEHIVSAPTVVEATVDAAFMID